MAGSSAGSWGDEAAGEGALQDRLAQGLGAGKGGVDLRAKRIGAGEALLQDADDLFNLRKRRERHGKPRKDGFIDRGQIGGLLAEFLEIGLPGAVAPIRNELRPGF
ncbi:hypothetical protein ACFOHS_08950 [Jhaorihella thermophila]